MLLQFLSFRKEDLGTCRCHFVCAFLEFWMIHPKLRGAVQHGSASPLSVPGFFWHSWVFWIFTGQFQTKPLLTLWFPYPPNTHTQAANCYQPIRGKVDESVKHTGSYSVPYFFWMIGGFTLQLQKPEGYPHPPTNTDLRRMQLHMGRLHLALHFAKTPESDVPTWSLLDVWALQIPNTHRHKLHIKQTNQDIHNKGLLLKTKNFSPQNLTPGNALNFPAAG